MKSEPFVIDGRNLTQADVRKVAQQHFGVKLFESDPGPKPGDHGFLIRGDPLNYYHVQSVMPGLYVASPTKLNPDQTRALVREFLKEELNG